MLDSADAWLYALAAGANAVIGAYVFFSDPKRPERQAFFLFVLGGVSWSIGIVFLLETHNFLFDKLVHYGALLAVFGLVRLALMFPRPYPLPVRPWLIYLPLLISAVAIVPWNFVIARIELHGTTIIPVNGPLHALWCAILLAYVVLSIVLLYRQYRRCLHYERRQLGYVLVGTAIFMLSAVIFDGFMPEFVRAPHLLLVAPFMSVLFVLLTTYAITRVVQEQQRQFFDELTHAFQTPLAVLRSRTDLLHSQTGDLMLVEPLRKSIDALSGMVSDMLELARLETLPAEEPPSDIDLSALVQEVIEYVEVIAAQQDISIETDIEPHVRIRAHAGGIQEMLRNLLSNAIKYTSGSAVRRIGLRLYTADSKAVLAIEDTGIGIPAEHLPYIFGRYKRGVPDSNYKGYGLGLAIAKQIVENYDGTIRAESTPGQGTRMIVTFKTSG